VFRGIGDELDDALRGETVDRVTGEITGAPVMAMDEGLQLGLRRLGRVAAGAYKQPEVSRFIGEVRRMVAGGEKLTGKNLMALRTDINNAMRDYAAAPGKGTASALLRDLIGELDGWIARSVPDELSAKWVTTRDQWRMLQVLEAPGVVNPKGQVNIQRLWGRLNDEYPAEFMRGGDQLRDAAALRARYGGEGRVVPQPIADLFDVARAGARFGDIVGNSGTPTRLAVAQTMDAPLAGAAMIAAQAIGRQIGKGQIRSAAAQRAMNALIRKREAEEIARAVRLGGVAAGGGAGEAQRQGRPKRVEFGAAP
jgi:hypothetical protein